MKKTKVDETPDISGLGRAVIEIVLKLVSNPEVYKGTAQDAAKLPKLARQIIDELLIYGNGEHKD